MMYVQYLCARGNWREGRSNQVKPRHDIYVVQSSGGIYMLFFISHDRFTLSKPRPIMKRKRNKRNKPPSPIDNKPI